MGLRGKKSEVRYWASRKGGGFFCVLNGKQYELALGPDDSKQDGPVWQKARKEYGRLMCMEDGVRTSEFKLSGLRDRYRKHLTEMDPDTLYDFDRWTAGFFDRHADMRVGALEHHHVLDWLAEQKTWRDGSKERAGKLIAAAFGWAKPRVIPVNPLEGIKLPKGTPRGRRARMSPELCQLLIDHANTPEFRLVLRALRVTGARPIEIGKAEVDDYARGRITYYADPAPGKYVWKCARTGKDRIITIPAPLREEIEAGIAGRTSGPLLLTTTGRQWTYKNMCNQFVKTKKTHAVSAYLREHGIRPRDVRLYNFRHTFLSEWVDSGRSTMIAAELCGTSAAMIERVYGHLSRERAEEFYDEFMAGRPV